MADKKVLIVTGAGRGIGREIALQAAAQGFAVIAASLSGDNLSTLAADINARGGTCVSLEADVTDKATAQRIVDLARERFGRIDVLINNAGAASAGNLLEQDEALIDAQWQLHVAAPLRITRAAFDLLHASKGQVMFTGSGLARVPSPYYGAYCAAKAAVKAMTTQLGRELHGSGIAVTYIDPGSVRTNFSKSAGIVVYGTDWAAVEPAIVAQRILRGIKTRPREINAVPWHTLGAILGEWFPFFTDRAMARQNQPRPQPNPTPAPEPQPPPPAPAPQTSTSGVSDFDRALEPVERRMERVKLSKAFVAQLLRPGDEIQLTDAAMRWAGMPNKNERAAMADVLDALAASGFLEKTAEEHWRVTRSAN